MKVWDITNASIFPFEEFQFASGSGFDSTTGCAAGTDMGIFVEIREPTTKMTPAKTQNPSTRIKRTFAPAGSPVGGGSCVQSCGGRGGFIFNDAAQLLQNRA